MGGAAADAVGCKDDVLLLYLGLPQGDKYFSLLNVRGDVPTRMGDKRSIGVNDERPRLQLLCKLLVRRRERPTKSRSL